MSVFSLSIRNEVPRSEMHCNNQWGIVLPRATFWLTDLYRPWRLCRPRYVTQSVAGRRGGGKGPSFLATQSYYKFPLPRAPFKKEPV